MSNSRMSSKESLWYVIFAVGLVWVYCQFNYNPFFKDDYINRCIAAGQRAGVNEASSPNLCNCFYGILTRDYSYSEAKDFFRDTSSGKFQTFYQKGINECSYLVN